MGEKIAARWLWMQKTGAFSLGMMIAFLLTIKGTAFFNVAVGILLLCALVCCRRTRPAKLFPDKITLRAFLVFVAALLLSAVLQGEGRSLTASLDFVHLLVSFFLLYFGTRLFGSEKIFYKAILWGAMIEAGLCLYAFSWQQFMNPAYRFDVWGQPNVVAQLLAMPLPFIAAALYKLRRERTWVAAGLVSFGIILLALLMTKSRGGIAGLAAGALIVATVYWPLVRSNWNVEKKIWGSTAIVLAVSLLALLAAAQVVPRSYDMARVQMLQLAIEMLKDYPLTGVGFDNWFRELPQYVYHVGLSGAPQDWVHAHNDLFQLLAATGMIGASGYVFFTLSIWFVLLRHLAGSSCNVLVWAMMCVMIIFYVHSLVDVCMFQRQVVRMFFGMLGFVLAVADMIRLKEGES